MAHISLCMIVRNEQDFLPDCLASVAGLVSQMVVVDTGSTDQTPDLARQSGAEVHHFQWTDDFAAARNHALKFATGAWILMLDADERLHPQGLDVIRAAVAADDFDCGMLPLYNADALDVTPDQVLNGGRALAPPTNLPRLLRHTPDLCWRGMIHENVGDWVLAGDRPTKTIAAPIIHYGAVPSVRQDRQKDERNFRLLERYCQQEPDNLRAMTHFLAKLMARGELERARTIADTAWSRLVQIMADRGSEVGLRLVKTAVIDAVPLVTNRANLLLAHHQHQEAAAMCDQALSWRILHPNLYHARGLSWERCARAETDKAKARDMRNTAVQAFQAALTFHGQGFSTEIAPGVTSWSANTRLGTLFLALDDPYAAVHHFGEALEQLPAQDTPIVARTHLETVTGLIEAMIGCRYLEEAQAAAQKHQHLKCPDICILGAEAAERRGDFKTCLDLLKKAQARAKRMPFVDPGRGRMLAELFALANFYMGRLSIGPGSVGILAALLGDEPPPETLEDPARPDEERLRRLFRFLKAEHRLHQVQSALTAPAAARFPNLCQTLIELLQELNDTAAPS